MIKWAKEKFKEGYLQIEIAEALFVAPITVRPHLKGLKHKAKPKLVYKGTTKKERDEFVKQKYYAGYQQNEIAQAIGMHPMTVHTIISRNNFQQKPRPKLVYDFSQE